MINPDIIRAFAEEVTKDATAPIAKAKKMSAGMKALLGTTAVGGIALGAAGEQAKDDYVMGRRIRKQQGGV